MKIQAKMVYRTSLELSEEAANKLKEIVARRGSGISSYITQKIMEENLE